MPSRKQRRRRVKERRHEYEYVYVDDEGRELAPEDVEPEEEPPPRRAPADGKPRQKASKAPAGGRAVSSRQPQPPSWRRIGKRALIFGPFMFLTIMLLERNAGLATQLFITSQMMLLFIPFSYLMDRMLYRRFLRQAGGPGTESPRRRS
jgi:hypothetical protein